MSYTIKISPLARLDIAESKAWYEERSVGLGDRFYQHVSERIDYLTHSPQHFHTRYEDVRCALTKKFPFGIFFIIEEAEKRVFVIAVLHTSRNPQVWKNRVN